VRFDSFARLAGGHIQQGDGSVLGGKSSAGAIRVNAGAQHVLAAAVDGVGFGFGVHVPHTDLAFENSRAKLKEVNKGENKMQLTTMPCTEQLIQSCVRVPTEAPRLQRPPVQHSDACTWADVPNANFWVLRRDSEHGNLVVKLLLRGWH
jgi:hypothetical protein